MLANLNIDCSKMSNLTKQLLGSSIFADLVEHFNNPENQKRFEEWKLQREKQLERSKRYE
ncbi:MAG: hypothetical protein IJ423_05495 [Clostridia bacterium]|nr:hypothetical protein [Clostridia bacterium]MBQ8637424.1 hypothetical protein [Clostridia bacterium]